MTEKPTPEDEARAEKLLVENATHMGQWGGYVFKEKSSIKVKSIIAEAFAQVRAEGASWMLESIRASVDGYPDMGGDIKVMEAIQTLISKARAEEREKQDEVEKMRCPICSAIAPENEKDWPNTECVVCAYRDRVAELEKKRDELRRDFPLRHLMERAEQAEKVWEQTRQDELGWIVVATNLRGRLDAAEKALAEANHRRDEAERTTDQWQAQVAGYERDLSQAKAAIREVLTTEGPFTSEYLEARLRAIVGKDGESK